MAVAYKIESALSKAGITRTNHRAALNRHNRRTGVPSAIFTPAFRLVAAAARTGNRRIGIPRRDRSHLAILRQLRELGVSTSMDDFGIGYSCLSYLRSFPFDKIKIDRSFVKDLAWRSDCVAIVRAISSLGRSLNITTTAEGVETGDQLDWLRAGGCNELQGFLFSAAKPAGEIEALLAGFATRASKTA
jgi:EAL domain